MWLVDANCYCNGRLRRRRSDIVLLVPSCVPVDLIDCHDLARSYVRQFEREAPREYRISTVLYGITYKQGIIACSTGCIVVSLHDKDLRL